MWYEPTEPGLVISSGVLYWVSGLVLVYFLLKSGAVEHIRVRLKDLLEADFFRKKHADDKKDSVSE